MAPAGDGTVGEIFRFLEGAVMCMILQKRKVKKKDKMESEF